MKNCKKLAAVFLSCIFVMAGCNNDAGGNNTPAPEHQHTFATTWSTSADSHWHAATCEHTDQKKDLASHNFDAESGICTVCEFHKFIGDIAPGYPKEVGNVVFTDGSATSNFVQLTAAQKAAVIAVIFYVGNGLNNEGSATRTLGLGLKHSEEGVYAWCSETAKGYDKNITTIQETCKNGKENLERMGTFLDAENDTTGEGAETRYPAFYWAKNYKNVATNLVGTSFETGWYLPSNKELEAVKNTDLDTVNNALRLIGGDEFFMTAYWSSTQEAGETNAKKAKWESSNSSNVQDKSSAFGNRVRAIREF